MVLKEGEKYISVRLNVGKVQALIFEALINGKKEIDIAAYKNEKHEENPQSPHYRSKNVAIWINKKKGIEQNREETV